MMGTLPGKADWFATMERAGVPMFNDVEEMAEAAGLLARYPALRDTARDNPYRSVTIRTRHRPLNQKIVRVQPISVDSRVLHFCNFLWTCGYSVATIDRKRGRKAWGADRVGLASFAD